MRIAFIAVSNTVCVLTESNLSVLVCHGVIIGFQAMTFNSIILCILYLYLNIYLGKYFPLMLIEKFS